MLLGQIRETNTKTLQDRGEVYTDECEYGIIMFFDEYVVLFAVSVVVQSFLCLPERFYDWNGDILFHKLHLDDTTTKGPEESIIGFFKFRRASPLRPTLREKGILKNFTECFKNGKHNPLFLLFTQQVNVTRSIHTFDYKIYTFTCVKQAKL